MWIWRLHHSPYFVSSIQNIVAVLMATYLHLISIHTHIYIYMCVCDIYIYICHQCVSLCREADTCKYESWCRIKQHSMGFFKPVSNLSIQYTAWGKLTWMWNTHCFPGKMICKWRGFHIYVGLRKIILKKNIVWGFAGICENGESSKPWVSILKTV